MTKYQSKLAAGQTAWLIRGNEVVSMPIGLVTVKSLAVEETTGTVINTEVVYSFRIYGADKRFREWAMYPENKCFATKRELLDSL
jgi:hypothetical protein